MCGRWNPILPHTSTSLAFPPPKPVQTRLQRTADKGREENEADDLPLLVSSSSTLPREPRKMPRRPTRKQLEMAGFSHVAGLLEVSKRSVLYAAMTTFPYMQRLGTWHMREVGLGQDPGHCLALDLCDSEPSSHGPGPFLS